MENMEEYRLKYQKSAGIKYNIHPSWYELCEKQTKEEVISILKKHLYEPDEYILHFYGRNGFLSRKNNQSFFFGSITRKDESVLGGLMPVGSVYFDYYDDTVDDFDFKHVWPEINCEKALTNPTAKFVVVEEHLMPSQKEYEIICEKSAERFIKRLHKSVSFPLEMACDYPDVIFEICYDCKPEQNLISDTLKVITDYVDKYNKRHDDGIHYVGEVSDNTVHKKANAVYIHIDFGDSNIEALALVIRAIAKSNLPIKEMTLL